MDRDDYDSMDNDTVCRIFDMNLFTRRAVTVYTKRVLTHFANNISTVTIEQLCAKSEIVVNLYTIDRIKCDYSQYIENDESLDAYDASTTISIKKKNINKFMSRFGRDIAVDTLMCMVDDKKLILVWHNDVEDFGWISRPKTYKDKKETRYV
jgi:hypothetical protein